MIPMSKNGVYTPFKPLKDSEHVFGVRVTDRYDLGQHSRNFSQGPVTSMVEENQDDQLWMYGWSSDPESEDTYMYNSHHSWSISKLYHTYSGGENFIRFWTRTSSYCEPLRTLYVVRHGSEFQNIAEIAYGSYENELFEVITDGQGGYILIERDLEDIDSRDDIEVLEDRSFSLDIDSSVVSD